MLYFLAFVAELLVVAGFFWMIWVLLIKAFPGLALKWKDMTRRYRFLPRICGADPVERDPATVTRKEMLTAFLTILGLLLLTRLVLAFIGYGIDIASTRANYNFLSSIPERWRQWDATNYLFIAENGYVGYEQAKMFDPTDRYYLIVFFPFYPVLIKLAWFFIRDYNWAAIFVSNACLLGAGVMFYKLLRLDYSKSVALRSVVFLLIFPVTFFFSIQFSESTFLLLSVSILYALRRQNWVLAGVLGIAISLTRLQGILLLIPFFIEALRGAKTFGRFVLRMLPALLFGVGIFIYLLINYIVFDGKWFQFMEFQTVHWGQTFGFFPDVVGGMVTGVLHETTYKGFMVATSYIPQLAAIFFGLYVLCRSVDKLRLSYALFAFVYFFVSISPARLLSAPRYIMGLALLFPCIALTFRTRVSRITVTALMGVSLGYCAFVYSQGYFIM